MKIWQLLLLQYEIVSKEDMIQDSRSKIQLMSANNIYLKTLKPERLKK